MLVIRRRIFNHEPYAFHGLGYLLLCAFYKRYLITTVITITKGELYKNNYNIPRAIQSTFSCVMPFFFLHGIV